MDHAQELGVWREIAALEAATDDVAARLQRVESAMRWRSVLVDLARALISAAVMLQIASWAIEAFSPYERSTSILVCKQWGEQA